jgi:hypothetical protein
MDTPEELLLRLGSEATTGYGRLPIPNPLDDEVRQLLGYISSADEATRTAVIGLLGEHHGFVFCAFAERMANFAVRTGEPRYLGEAVVALAIADRLIDQRECLLVLAPLYHATTRIGIDPVALFVAPVFAGDLFREYLSDFPRRPEESRSLAAMGYVESSDADGFRYKRTW